MPPNTKRKRVAAPAVRRARRTKFQAELAPRKIARCRIHEAVSRHADLSGVLIRVNRPGREA